MNPLLQRELWSSSAHHAHLHPHLPPPSCFSIRKWGWGGIIWFMNWNAASSLTDRGEYEEYPSLPLAWGYPKVRSASKKPLHFHLELSSRWIHILEAWQDSKAVLWSWVSALFQQEGWHRQQPWSSCQLHTTTEGNEDSFFQAIESLVKARKSRKSSLWPRFYFWKKQVWVDWKPINQLHIYWSQIWLILCKFLDISHSQSNPMPLCWAFQCICHSLWWTALLVAFPDCRQQQGTNPEGWRLLGDRRKCTQIIQGLKSQPKSSLTIKYVTQDRHFHLLATMWPPSAPWHRKKKKCSTFLLGKLRDFWS